MARIGSIIFVLFFSVTTLFGQDDSQNFSLPRTVVAAGAATAATSLSHADLAYLKKHVSSNSRGIKGAFGESIAQKAYLKNYLEKNGNWKNLTPRLGSQGLDHVFVKYDKYGHPKQLMVAESKYGSSKLGFTKDGIQMGREWTSKRLIKLGKTYSSLSKYTNMKTGKVPFFCDEKMEVHLKNGKTEYFYRNNSREPWKFSGTQSELSEAQAKAKEMGYFLDANGRGVIDYRSRIFHIEHIEGGKARITVYDAQNIQTDGNVSWSKLKKISEASGYKPQEIEISSSQSSKELQRTLTKELRKLGLNKKDAADTAKYLKNDPRLGGYSWRNLLADTFKTSVAAGVAAAVIDVGMQFINTGKVDIKQAAFTGGTVAIGTLVGESIQIALTKQVTQQVLGKTLTSLLSTNAAAIAVTALLAYGNWLIMGNGNLRTATTDFMTGLAVWGAIELISILSGIPELHIQAAMLAISAVVLITRYIFKRLEIKYETKKIMKLLEIYSIDENMERLVTNSFRLQPSI